MRMVVVSNALIFKFKIRAESYMHHHAFKLANVFENLKIFADYSTSSDWKLDKMINRNGMHSMTCFSTIDFAMIMIFDQFEVVLRPLPIMDENYNGHFFSFTFFFFACFILVGRGATSLHHICYLNGVILFD